MDPKSGASANNCVKNQDDLAKLPPKSRTNDTNTSCKQMPASNSAEPKQRVIKQIVSLDPKKLKALGIESNILSALTKFNGKDKAANNKTNKTVSIKNVEPIKSPIESSAAETINAAISTVEPIIAVAGSSAVQKKPDETLPSKKIQVLSNVLLNDNKLDLNIFPVIASSSTPVSSKQISYVTQVPRPSQIKRIDTDNVPFGQVSSSIVVQHEKVKPPIVAVEKTINVSNPPKSPLKVSLSSPEKSSITPTLVQKLSPVKYSLKSPSPVKKVEESSAKQPDNETTSSPVDSLKGFSLPELKCSQNQFEHLQNEVLCTTSTISTHEVAQDNEIELLEEKPKIELSNEIGVDLSNTFTTSETMSSDQSSDSESDLNELIVEAQLTIENERARESDDSDETEESPEPKVLSKKPRLVKKKLLDKLTEQVDNDRLIREFLDSTINSFRPASPSDSDSSDDRVDSDSDADMDADFETPAEINEPSIELFDGEISMNETNDPDVMAIEPVDEEPAEAVESKITPNESVVENISPEETVQCETVEVASSKPEPRKRKNSANCESNSKRKKSKSINEHTPSSSAAQSQNSSANFVDEPKISKDSSSIVQGKMIQNMIFLINCYFMLELNFQKYQRHQVTSSYRSNKSSPRSPINQWYRSVAENQNKPF